MTLTAKLKASRSLSRMQLTKLYPEGGAEARFRMERVRYLYAYCNHHGLFRLRL